MALTPLSKNAVTMNPMTKAGNSWDYDDAGITYDGATDAEGRTVSYDGIGSSFTATPLAKNSVVLSGQSKNNV